MNQYVLEKQVRDNLKRAKFWSHDVKFVDGVYIEDVVNEFQKTGNEDILLKIFKNYMPFKNVWIRAYSAFCDNDPESAIMAYQESIWKAAIKFDMSKAEKMKGKAFNAYCVSTCLNDLKNRRNVKMAHKNHPRVKCSICNEIVYQIDAKHLAHRIDDEKYTKMHRRYPLVSTDGKTICPITGRAINEITEQYLNRVNKSYRLDDFYQEFAGIIPKMPIKCPMTGIKIEKFTSEYPSWLGKGFTEETFIQEYPNYPGLIRCPFTGKKIIEMTQAYINKVLKQKTIKTHTFMRSFCKKYPKATVKAKQVKVMNPYTSKLVKELTPEMLAQAGTTVQEHLEIHAEILLNKFYPDKMTCPFTGKKRPKFTFEYLQKLNKSVFDFYMAVCKYPLRKWYVKCGECGEWVENIWTHLESANHTYAKAISTDVFIELHGPGSTRAVVSTNAFLVNESGDQVHIADLFPKKKGHYDPVEIEDSLITVAKDDMDYRLAKSLRTSQTVEDVCCTVSNRKTVVLPFVFEPGKSKATKDAIRKVTGIQDFDFFIPPLEGDKKVKIMIPGRDSIHQKLVTLIQNSDLAQDHV